MIDKERLGEALHTMGNKHVKPQFRNDWSPKCPTIGNCYYVSEVIYHCLAPEGSKPYRLIDEDNEGHWFLRDPNGEVIDLTADQYDKPPDYSKGKHHAFRTKQMSKPACRLADLLDLKPIR